MGQFEEIEEMDNNPLELTHASVIANFSGRSISRTTYVVKERFLSWLYAFEIRNGYRHIWGNGCTIFCH